MLVIKYRKTGQACYISHIDLLKHMGRIIRRADINVDFSQGFNPHPILFFSPPLVLGCPSLCEYVFISTPMDSEDAFNRYKSSVPDGLKALTYFQVNKNPNLQANVFAADFVFPVPYKNIDFSSFIIKYKKKDTEIEEDVASKIYGSYEYNGRLCLRIASGNSPLRPDRLLNKLSEIYGEEIELNNIVKINQYILDGNEYIDVDEYLKERGMNIK